MTGDYPLQHDTGINKKLGLPFGDGMQKVAIAFDVDGTLMHKGDIGQFETFALLNAFLIQGWKNVDFIIWSGWGADYARHLTESRLNNGRVNNVTYASKLEYKDLRKKYKKIIAIDDVHDTRLGDVNLIVRNK